MLMRESGMAVQQRALWLADAGIGASSVSISQVGLTQVMTLCGCDTMHGGR